MSATRSKRKKPAGRGKTGISPGRVMDVLVCRMKESKDFAEELSAAYRFDFSRAGYAPRVFLRPEHVAPALEQADATMDEMFREAGCNVVPELEDQEMEKLIGSLDEGVLTQVLTLIRECQEPWWIPLMDGTPISVPQRLQTIMRCRLGCHDNWEKLARDYPMLAQYEPLSKVFFIQTDDLPALARELDVHVSSLTELGCTVPWYSSDPLVDRVFAEYRMLDRSMRSIVLHYVRQKKEGGSHGRQDEQ